MATGSEYRWIPMELFHEYRQQSSERRIVRGASILRDVRLQTGRAERIR